MLSIFNLIFLHIKNMFRRRNFFIVMIVTLLFSLMTYLVDALPLYGSGVTGHLAPWSYWGPMDKDYGISMQLWQAMYIFLFPFLASFAYADCYFSDRQNGALNNLLARSSRERYFISGAIVVFWGGFFIFFISLLINQLLWLITTPLNTVLDAFSDGGITCMMFPSVYAKHVYLNNIIYMIIPGITGGLIALLSYSLSLFFNKKKFAVLTAPSVAYVVLCFIAALTSNQIFNLAYYMTPVSPVTSSRLWFLFIVLTMLIVTNTFALFWKIKIAKDEL